METRKRELFEIVGDYNNRQLYRKFNELKGTNVEFEIDQDYGTGCYGIIPFNESLYPTLEDLEIELEEYIGIYEIVNYLRRVGELPEADFLFSVSY